MARAVDEGDMALQTILSTAPVALARWIDLFLTFVGPVTRWTRALGIVALVDFCIRIAELNGDVALELVLEPDGLHARNGFDYRALSVCDVADCADVDCGLARDDLG